VEEKIKTNTQLNLEIAEEILPVTVHTIKVGTKRLTKSFIDQISHEDPNHNDDYPIGWINFVQYRRHQQAVVLWIPHDKKTLKKCYRSLKQVQNLKQIFI